jgi:hypothetical protein
VRFKEREGDVEMETLSTWFSRGRRPRDQKAQESKRPRPELNIQVAVEARLLGEVKPLKHQCKAHVVLQQSARTANGVETCLQPPERSKALKSEAQERGKLKKVFQGSGELTPLRG